MFSMSVLFSLAVLMTALLLHRCQSPASRSTMVLLVVAMNQLVLFSLAGMWRSLTKGQGRKMAGVFQSLASGSSMVWLSVAKNLPVLFSLAGLMMALLLHRCQSLASKSAMVLLVVAQICRCFSAWRACGGVSKTA